jgi:hypothetical protein
MTKLADYIDYSKIKDINDWKQSVKELADYVIELVVEANANDEEDVEIVTEDENPCAYIQACLEYLTNLNTGKQPELANLWDKLIALVKVGQKLGINVY